MILRLKTKYSSLSCGQPPRTPAAAYVFSPLKKPVQSSIRHPPSQHIFLLVRNPQAARVLVEGGVPIDRLCIGNMHAAPGKTETRDAHVYMDEKDLEDLRFIRNTGADVYIQIAPGDAKLDFES